jgi:hypothetical protein
LYPTDFHNCKEELKNALATSRSKVWDLKIKVREIKAGGLELKRAMKEATDSEYAISQKLAYETGARRGLEAEFEAVLKSLQSDQITIARYEVKLNDLKGAANYAMSCIAVPEEGEQQQSIVDRLLEFYESNSSVEADEDTDVEVGGDAGTGSNAGGVAKSRRKTRSVVAKQSASSAAAAVSAVKAAEKKKKRKRKATSPPTVVTP